MRGKLSGPRASRDEEGFALRALSSTGLTPGPVLEGLRPSATPEPAWRPGQQEAGHSLQRVPALPTMGPPRTLPKTTRRRCAHSWGRACSPIRCGGAHGHPALRSACARVPRSFTTPSLRLRPAHRWLPLDTQSDAPHRGAIVARGEGRLPDPTTAQRPKRRAGASPLRSSKGSQCPPHCKSSCTPPRPHRPIAGLTRFDPRVERPYTARDAPAALPGATHAGRCWLSRHRI